MAFDINIALVEPRIPQNTGNIIRTCAVTGCKLHLVKPLGFSMEDSLLKRAGLDYWEYADIRLYDTFEQLFEQYPLHTFYYASTKGELIYSDVQYPDKCFLVFGREDAGLPEALLAANRQTVIRIPMKPGIRSLNLSNSAALILYETLRQRGFPELNFIPDKNIFT